MWRPSYIFISLIFIFFHLGAQPLDRGGAPPSSTTLLFNRVLPGPAALSRSSWSERGRDEPAALIGRGLRSAGGSTNHKAGNIFASERREPSLNLWCNGWFWSDGRLVGTSFFQINHDREYNRQLIIALADESIDHFLNKAYSRNGSARKGKLNMLSWFGNKT